MGSQKNAELGRYQGTGVQASNTLIIPDWDERQAIALDAGIDFCWTCGTCDNGCPVSLATGRLRPQHTVRMAVYGLIDELVSLPNIWYCISCRQCLHGCPNLVKPYELHQHLQMEALFRGIYPKKFFAAYRELLSQFQRVRWRTAAHCFERGLDLISDTTWYKWLRAPLRKAIYHPIRLNNRQKEAQLNSSFSDANNLRCFSCNECSGCCPIRGDGAVFDPQKIIRMVNLGLTESLLKSPAIWLCLRCRQCIEACSMTVSGYSVIEHLQRQAIDNGFVDPLLPIRLLEADRIIYPKLLDEIDTLIGLYAR
ncbi:MAG: 4Fe-4S dicluster domain-containing protein [Desulfobacteraceae bacterium]|nr:4Fe-4S dicluster domain-containing protein [Desulfobacteraceae bacterium]